LGQIALIVASVAGQSQEINHYTPAGSPNGESVLLFIRGSHFVLKLIGSWGFYSAKIDHSGFCGNFQILILNN
jgi:hypothetical protein